ncbi:MAG: GNAT family N-acetyltransferase [SAR324 cluster bacterium]|nr:GNAT family N-acetyltransferase [SAR324 cluster bacterium]MBL7035827.1 GNAT family N-acetyltransferase [SAR324 cluster bacterium]
MTIIIDFAKNPVDYINVKNLFLDYAENLGFSLSFQGFEEELENLPGKYAAPDGCILLARDELNSIGCVALRPLSNKICEMKRLYVKPAWRGAKLGRLLAERIIRLGTEKQYKIMQLDTLSSMNSAISLYKSLGFEETDPYYHNPHPDVKFFKKRLDATLVS